MRLVSWFYPPRSIADSEQLSRDLMVVTINGSGIPWLWPLEALLPGQGKLTEIL